MNISLLQYQTTVLNQGHHNDCGICSIDDIRITLASLQGETIQLDPLTDYEHYLGISHIPSATEDIGAWPTLFANSIGLHTYSIYNAIKQPTEYQLSHAIYNSLANGHPLEMTCTLLNIFGGCHSVEVVGVNTTTNVVQVVTWGTQYFNHGELDVSLDNFYTAKGGNPNQLQEISEVSIPGEHVHIVGSGKPEPETHPLIH